ncbi:hypothetical protein [Enterococcus olivae]
MKIPPSSTSSFYSQPTVPKPESKENEPKKEQETKVEQVPKPKVKKVQKYPEGAQHWAEQIRLHHPEKYAEWVARHKKKKSIWLSRRFNPASWLFDQRLLRRTISRGKRGTLKERPSIGFSFSVLFI